MGEKLDNKSDQYPQGSLHPLEVKPMFSARDRVIVGTGECACHSMPTAHVHHSHFPEIQGESLTPYEAARELVRLLNRSLDCIGSQWRRDILHAAIADVEEFLGELQEEDGEAAPPPHFNDPEGPRTGSQTTGAENARREFAATLTMRSIGL
jgi:hypothetical protein